VGLLPAYLLAVVAQPFDVVQVHAGHDGAVGVDDVDRVQASAQPHFQDDHVQRRLREQPQDGQRGQLEIGQRGIAAGRVHGGELSGQGGIAGGLAVHARPLVEIQQVRRGVEADPVSGAQQHGLEHGAGRALAVGASHHDLDRVQVQLQARGHLAHAVQAHVYRAAMDGFEIGQPLRQGAVGIGTGSGGRRHGYDRQGRKITRRFRGKRQRRFGQAVRIS